MRRVSIPIAIAALLIATDVFAQTASQNHDDAVKLFLEGKKHRDEEHCELAISPLEASIQKEPSIGAHYNLGVCYEKTNNKRKALDNYNSALKIAKDKHDDREREIRAQLSDFLDHTAHIRIVVPPPVPSGMKITVDGDPIPSQQPEQETIWFAPKDKGDYQLTATAPGYENKSMTVRRGALATVVLAKIASETPRTEDEGGGFQWWHGVGIGGIVVGAVGVAYALANYFSYNNKRSQYESQYRDLSNDAAAEAAKKSTPPTTPDKIDQKTMCTSTPRLVSQTTCDSRAAALKNYNDNEADGSAKLPLWLGIGIGGVLFIAAGTVLLVGGSSFFGKSSSSETKAAQNKTTIRFLPTLGPNEHGAVLVGTF